MIDIERAIKHIILCDRLFDGKDGRPDKEFAYQQVRLLAVELLEIIKESIKWPMEGGDEPITIDDGLEYRAFVRKIAEEHGFPLPFWIPTID